MAPGDQSRMADFAGKLEYGLRMELHQKSGQGHYVSSLGLQPNTLYQVHRSHESPRQSQGRTGQLSCREMLQNGSIQMVEFMLMHLKDQAAADTMQKGRSSPDNSFDIGGWVGRYPTTNECYVLIWPGTCASLGLRQ